MNNQDRLAVYVSEEDSRTSKRGTVYILTDELLKTYFTSFPLRKKRSWLIVELPCRLISGFLSIL